MIGTHAVVCGFEAPVVPQENLGGWQEFYNTIRPSLQPCAHVGLSLLAEAVNQTQSASDQPHAYSLRPLVPATQSSGRVINPELKQLLAPRALTRADHSHWNQADHGLLLEAAEAVLGLAATLTAVLEATTLVPLLTQRACGPGYTKLSTYRFGLSDPGLRARAGQVLSLGGQPPVAGVALRLQQDYRPDDDQPDGQKSWQPLHEFQLMAYAASQEEPIAQFGSLRAAVIEGQAITSASGGVVEGLASFAYSQDDPFRIVSALAAVLELAGASQ